MVTNFSTKQNYRITPLAIVNEAHTIAVGSVQPPYIPYTVKLIEVPSPNFPVTVPGYTQTQSITPGPGQYYVDFNTGYITFNSNVAGFSVFVSYNGMGSVVDAQDIDTIQTAINQAQVSGTDKAVQYNQSNVLAGDAMHFAWDYTNFRLGIGTPTPDQAVQVATTNSLMGCGIHVGPLYAGSGFPFSNAGGSNDVQIGFASDNTTDFAIYLANGGPTQINSPAGTNLQLSVANEVYAQIFAAGGNLGGVAINCAGALSSGSMLNVLSGSATIENDYNGDTYCLVKNIGSGVDVEAQFFLQTLSNAGAL